MHQLLKTTGFLICFFCSTVVVAQSRITDALKTLADHQTNGFLKAWYYSKTAKELWYINADSSLFYNRKRHITKNFFKEQVMTYVLQDSFII